MVVGFIGERLRGSGVDAQLRSASAPLPLSSIRNGGEGDEALDAILLVGAGLPRYGPPLPSPVASQARHESVSREGLFASRNVVPRARGQPRPRLLVRSSSDRIPLNKHRRTLNDSHPLLITPDRWLEAETCLL